MKTRLLMGTTLFAAVALTAALANAQQSGSNAAADLSGQPGSAPGAAEDWAGYAHVGYRLDPHWRVDLQGGYRAGAASPTAGPSGLGSAAGLCAASTAGAACDPRDRGLGAYAVVANLIFDMMPDNHWVDPFFGVGVGASRPDPAVIAQTNPALQILQLNARNAAFAYQALVGLAFRPHDRLRVDLTYRWLDGDSLVPAALAVRGPDQTLAINVRYALSSPRAAIAPAPMMGLASMESISAPRAETTRTIVVQTPSDPAALAAEAQAAVRETVLSARAGQSARVVVDGHADTASDAAYNQRLAERRSKAMADAMVALGVPASAVDLRWPGEASQAPQPLFEARQSLAAGN
jgi:OOP family OmpA-OmpF porin